MTDTITISRSVLEKAIALTQYIVEAPVFRPQSKTLALLNMLQAAIASPVQPPIPKRYALVPIRPTSAMEDVFQEEGWEWAHVLAAAEAVTEEEYVEALEHVGEPSECINFPLYRAVNELIAQIGFNGEINAHSPYVDRVMTELHKLDGGKCAERAEAHHDNSNMPYVYALKLAVSEFAGDQND